MPTPEERIWAAIDAMVPVGQLALQRVPQMARAHAGQITLEALADFFEVLAELDVQRVKDELANEADLGHRRAEDVCVHRFVARVMKAKP